MNCEASDILLDGAAAGLGLRVRPNAAGDGAGRGRIPVACESGTFGTCKVLKQSGKADMCHIGGIRDQELAGGYVLACYSRSLSAVESEA